VDEIHRLYKQVEEVLYPAMEDYAIDIMIGKGQSARSIRLDLPKFTLIGATTRAGLLSAPLRDRFGVIYHMEFYTPEELKLIIQQSARKLKVDIDEDAALELARRSRGTPRLSNRLLKRVRDFADVKNNGDITIDVCKDALSKLGIDEDGLDYTDYKYLGAIINSFNGGPVGLESLAATISEESSTIEDVYEPYLLQEGYIKRSQRGRIATEKAYNKLGIDFYKGIFA
jgi:Holliday junction DNA helicase RuvB